ncbi:MAG TPA: NPCBM/NEW2 domain-containing protein [Candidatus Paceibacterota bacterium]|nr:NPCBM/NEW2 domain-containing protein [Candidatus Paceibacterota bacterium]
MTRLLSILGLAFACASVQGEEIRLSTLDVSGIEQGWGEPQVNRSVGGRPFQIAGRAFTNGIGTHAASTIPVELNGNAARLSGWVGVDDETDRRGSVVFRIEADGREVWNSGVIRGGDAAREVSVDLSGVKALALSATDADDGIDFDHADWADIRVEMKQGQPRIQTAPLEAAMILTPKPSPKPRFTGAKVFGVRPGNPFLFTVTATGDRPMKFFAKGLPAGLSLDEESGRITGRVDTRGEYVVTLRAKNAKGRAERKFKIVCGDRIGLTPAMGWNSWNCFASAVTAEKIKAAADAMVSSGLMNHGWTYVNIDDFWQVHRDSKDATLQGPRRNDKGTILPNPRFPDMAGLANYVHDKGLKIGLYSSPGPWTCGGCVGSFGYELPDAQQYAEWGFDYLKYDWCSYSPAMEKDRNDPSAIANASSWSGAQPPDIAQLALPYKVMRDALSKQQRDILYSLCQYGMGKVWQWGDEVGGNSWRTTGDITDTWRSMSSIGFNTTDQAEFAGPGHFNDPDMLVVGKVGWGPQLHPTRLTPNEQYTHMSLWCLLASPLLIGCDLTQLDDFTLNLLTNDEVLAINQDSLGREAVCVAKDGQLEVWAKDLEDGTKAVGLFNRGTTEQTVTVKWSDLQLTGKQPVRDLWRQKDLGKFKGEFSAPVPRHGVVLVKIGAGGNL